MEKRKDEIEAEVKRRVEEAKHIMEKQMLQELEQQRAAEIELQKRKEVHSRFGWQCYTTVQIGAVLGFFLKDYCLTNMIRQKTEFSFTLINCGSWQMNIL